MLLINADESSYLVYLLRKGNYVRCVFLLVNKNRSVRILCLPCLFLFLLLNLIWQIIPDSLNKGLSVNILTNYCIFLDFDNNTINNFHKYI